MRTFFVLSLAIACHSSASTFADNWPHWRGDNGNSVSKTATPPTEWSDTKNVKWKVTIPGQGSGSPAIWEDKVFVVSGVPADSSVAEVSNEPQWKVTGFQQTRPQQQGRQQQGRQQGRSRSRSGGRGGAPLKTLQFTVFCFDRATGKELWKQVATEAKPHEATHSTNNFSSASPCTDGKHVYAHFGSRGLFCYSMDGQLVWKRDDLGKMQTRASFGEGSSPTLAGDKIIVPWDHEGPSSLYALNKLTGDTIWQTKRDEPTCWATPLIVEHDGRKQVVMNGQTKARSYDLETGKELWSCGGQTERPVASAVTTDGLVFVGSGHRGSFMAAFKPSGRGNLEGTDSVVWSINRDTPDIASPVLSNGRLYFHKGKTGVMTCVDAVSGKTIFGPTRTPGLDSIYASPVAAGGYVFLTGRNGTTVVIKDADQFEIVSTNSVGETVDATPAPVDNELFIRGEKHLFCISGS
ncbi:MAG: PQQ-binding-like beta-propeller repeat protein [Fuerstiella sp.]